MATGGPITTRTLEYLAKQGRQWNPRYPDHQEIDLILALCEQGIPNPHETVQSRAVQDWYQSQRKP